MRYLIVLAVILGINYYAYNTGWINFDKEPVEPEVKEVIVEKIIEKEKIVYIEREPEPTEEVLIKEDEFDAPEVEKEIKEVIEDIKEDVGKDIPNPYFKEGEGDSSVDVPEDDGKYRKVAKKAVETSFRPFKWIYGNTIDKINTGAKYYYHTYCEDKEGFSGICSTRKPEANGSKGVPNGS